MKIICPVYANLNAGMRISVWLLLLSVPALAAEPSAAIKVDQAGYLPSSPKIAFVAPPGPATTFAIHRVNDGKVVFSGKLSEPLHDPDSGDEVRAADFSALHTAGSFYLDAPGIGQSWPFAIADDVYRRAFYFTARSYYGQRCGTAVDLGPEFPGYKHDACHLNGAYHESSGKSGAKTTGQGWHDAGDYGRYLVNSGISTGTLLWTWELFGPRVRTISLNLPESGNGTPDLLNEIRWNLDWMLSMQDEDGGVWHKQTSDHFCPFIMPEKDTLISYVIGTGKEPFKSSCATGDFAAVMAIAARVYKPFDGAYAQRCLMAAEKAWAWLEKNPSVTFRNPPGITTGDYGDSHCDDEHFWAASELARTTHQPTYETYFRDHYQSYRAATPSWPNVAPLGLWTYVLGGGSNQDAVKSIRDDSITAANEIVERSTQNGYRISLKTTDYIWGSNGVAANYGMQLLVANAMHPDARYVQTALDNLHYLLGRNTFSLSYVTRVGANPFRHPHHRPSGADNNEEPWPGLLAGGPNHARQDPAMKSLPDLPPAKMYLDNQQSYATNEVAINWNAPLVFLLAGLLQK
jgi:endoglucanase